MLQRKIRKLIKLPKPLVIFEVETTGLGLSMDRVIEIAYLKLYTNGREKSEDVFLNPEIEISDESREIHGITDDQLKDKPYFREKAQEFWDIFYNCYYAGFNILSFDLPFLKREFARAGMNFEYSEKDVLDSKAIFNYMEPRTLSVAYKYYCNKEYEWPRSASKNVKTTLAILEKQLRKYKETRDLDFIRNIYKASTDRYIDNTRKFYWRNGKAHFAFSKYIDRSLSEVAEKDPKFLEWIIGADFSDETKNIVIEAMKEKRRTRNT